MFSSSEKMSVVNLKHSVIHLPKVNHEYRITQGMNKYSIIFKGNPAAMPLLFNSSIGNLRWADKLNDYRVLYYYIAKESLPPINNNISFPLLWVSPTLSTEPIITATIVKKMKLTITNKSDVRVISTYGQSISLETCNQKFKEIFQKYIDVPLKVGDYPIFLSKNRPSFSYLEKLYNNFIECNSDEKLNIQYKDTTDKCHVRAHFISELFYKNGIQTYKIFKVWDPKHW
ncbi:MAG: hypothetical protein JO131_08695, partial [Gammaproteobacteria bacterium]|nr:hypothetical protein [Gammaproteobacteria bacterium]